jgi:hypothetical protein
MQMSYSDKEKHMDYQSDDVESSAEKFNNPSNHSTVGNEKVDDILPVGQLKWRKDEEEEQDTHDSLEAARKFEPAKHDSDKEKDKEKKQEQTEEKKDSGNQFGSNEHGAPPSFEVEQPSSPHEKRQLSLEDTLTPIDFKEYSIDPVIGANSGDENFKEEVKKPSFVAEQPVEPRVEQPGFTKEKRQSPASHGDDDPAIDEKKEQIRKWVKILWLPVSLIVALYAGFVVGHTIIGDQPAGDFLNFDMWVHIYQLVFGS